MYKMVVFDIDGTLIKYKETSVKFDKQILKMFKELKKRGYIVVLATGRDHISIGELHLSKNVDYFIGANGSFIYDAKLKKDIWSTNLSISDFIKYKNDILDNNMDEIVNVILSDDKNIFAFSDEQIKDHWFWKDFTASVKSLDLFEREMNNERFHLITINCEGEKLINISKDYFINNPSSLAIQAYWNKGFFVSEKDLNKAKTIERLAKMLKIGNKEIIAFGDGENDLQMIKMSGLGIAMENGVELLKDVADDVAKNVTEYGTYYKLKELGII